MVLCYHAVSPTWDADLSVTPAALERQLTWLTRHGWRGSTFSQAVDDPPSSRTLVVTFDDAFRSVRELAQPILSSLGIPGTMFVPTSFPDTGKPLAWAGTSQWQETEHAHELSCLSWEEIGELSAAGWEIGSHTRRHPHLTSVDLATLHEELEGSRADLKEQLGFECSSIAYPYGDTDDRVASAAATAGYTAGAAMSSHLARRGRLRCPRIGVYHLDHFRRFRLKTMHPIRILRASPMWPRDRVR
jgi:peptidoglycan/xylan/chitin deacetylase (PgdA/CDA1 family)